MTTSTRRLRRSDVVDTALQILARVGLPDLTMRAIGTELGVQQSALYHHFANKQAVLAAVALFLLLQALPTFAAPAEEITGGQGFFHYIWPLIVGTLENDVLPVLSSLDNVGPEVHQILEVAQQCLEALAGIPGFQFLRRRGENGKDG